MTSFGTVPLKQVWAMLEQCAPGHTRKSKTHNWVIQYNGRTFPALPLGPHGRRENPGIEVGILRKMARHLDILECAKRELSQL